MIIFFFVWVHNFVVKCHISKGEVDEIELPYNSVCKQKKIHLNFYFQIHATFPPDDRRRQHWFS